MPLRVVPVVRVTNTNLVRGGQMPLGGCCRIVRSRARSTRLCASCRHRRRCGWYRRSHVALHTRSVRSWLCLFAILSPCHGSRPTTKQCFGLDGPEKSIFGPIVICCVACNVLRLLRPPRSSPTRSAPERSTAPAHKPSPAAVETRAVAVEPQPERKHRHVGGKWFAMSEFVEKFGMDSLTSCKCSTRMLPKMKPTVAMQLTRIPRTVCGKC